MKSGKRSVTSTTRVQLWDKWGFSKEERDRLHSVFQNQNMTIRGLDEIFESVDRLLISLSAKNEATENWMTSTCVAFQNKTPYQILDCHAENGLLMIEAYLLHRSLPRARRGELSSNTPALRV